MAEGRQAGADGGLRPATTQLEPLFRSAPATPDPVGSICPFLAREGADGQMGPAVPAVDDAHRCVALGQPIPQSSRQQELVCLTSAHGNCPRYLRGAQLADQVPAVPVSKRTSPAVIIAAAVFVGAIVASFAFLAVRGGFAFAIPSAGPSQVAVLPVPSASVAAGPTGSNDLPTPASASGAPGGSSSPPSPPANASPSPTPAPAGTPRPSAKPTSTPASGTAARYALLTACPSTPGCWIYVIRRGDNLQSIANWFGVPYRRLLAMNPRLRIPIHPGDQLRMPTPTR